MHARRDDMHGEPGGKILQIVWLVGAGTAGERV